MEELDKGYEFTKAQLAELESLRSENAQLKNNHATEVRRARILKERTDMPIERVAAYDKWGEDLTELEDLRAWKAEIEKQKPVAWFSKNDITGLLEVEWTKEKPIYEGIWTPMFAKKYFSFCDIERPCIPCFIDKGQCESYPVVSPDVEKLKAEIAELKSHNKRIMDMYVEYSDENRSLKAREAQLREALEEFPSHFHILPRGEDCKCSQCRATRKRNKALALPHDDTALKEYLAKAQQEEKHNV